jgi:hypothetical protein
VADVQPHVSDLQHVGGAERVPRVHHAIMAKGDRNALRHQLLDARLPASFRIGVVTALQRDVDQRTLSFASFIRPKSLLT